MYNVLTVRLCSQVFHIYIYVIRTIEYMHMIPVATTVIGQYYRQWPEKIRARFDLDIDLLA